MLLGPAYLKRPAEEPVSLWSAGSRGETRQYEQAGHASHRNGRRDGGERREPAGDEGRRERSAKRRAQQDGQDDQSCAAGVVSVRREDRVKSVVRGG